MNLKTKLSLLFFIGIFIFARCKSEVPKTSERQAISAKVDSTYALLANLRIEQLKISNQIFEDPKITAAIKEYATAKTISERIQIVDRLAPDERPPVEAPPNRTQEQRRYFTSFLDKVQPDQFDLAIQSNDVIAEQVKLMNTYFGDLDKGTLDAIAFYEKLTKADKVKYFFAPDQSKPIPDYMPQWVRREFQLAYYFQRQALQQQLQRRLLQTRFINEFPQGFKQMQGLGAIDDETQFDLSLIQK